MADRKALTFTRKDKNGNTIKVLDSLVDFQDIGWVKLRDRLPPYSEDIIQTYEKDLVPDAQNARYKAKLVRDKALSESTVTYNGNVYQARPEDFVNFRTMIDRYVDTDTIKWILADNTTAIITIADLKAVYNLAVDSGKAIFDTYISELESL